MIGFRFGLYVVIRSSGLSVSVELVVCGCSRMSRSVLHALIMDVWILSWSYPKEVCRHLSCSLDESMFIVANSSNSEELRVWSNSTFACPRVT